MHRLVLVVPLLTALFTQATPPPPSQATAGPAERCAQARQIAEQRPCLRAEDCAAFHEWTRTFGAPGAEPLTPRSASAAVQPAGRPTAGTVERRLNPPVFDCPAVSGDEPATPGAP